MSLEAWGDGGSHDEHYADGLEQAFIRGAQAMREQLARFIEQDGNVTVAQSVRLNWIPSWGDDPGAWQGEMPYTAGL